MKKVILCLMAVLLIAVGVITASAANVTPLDVKDYANLGEDYYTLLQKNVLCNYEKPWLFAAPKAYTECYVTPANFCYVWARLQRGDEIVFDSNSDIGVEGRLRMNKISISGWNKKADQVWNGAYRTVDGKVGGDRDVDARIEVYDYDYLTLPPYLW